MFDKLLYLMCYLFVRSVGLKETSPQKRLHGCTQQRQAKEESLDEIPKILSVTNSCPSLVIPWEWDLRVIIE